MGLPLPLTRVCSKGGKCEFAWVRANIFRCTRCKRVMVGMGYTQR